MNRIKLKFIVLFLFSSPTLMAQDYLSFLSLGDYVTQTQDLSPVYIPENTLTFGSPANIGLTGYSGIKLGDILVKNQDVLKFDLNSLNASAKRRNNVNYDLTINIFSIALKTKKGSISLFANTKSSLSWQFSNAFTNILANGFAKSFGLSEEKLRFTAYNEVGVGYTNQLFKDKLSIGFRMKYLNGMAHVETAEKASFAVDINPLNWIVKASDAFVLSSGLNSNEVDLPTITKNKGLGFDIGAKFNASDRFSFEISVLDIGYIEWSENVKTYKIDDTTEATYNGIDLNTNGDILDEAKDVFENVVGSTEVAETFRSNLETKAYISANYQLSDKNLFRLSFNKTQSILDITPSFSLGYNRTLRNSTYGVLVSSGGLDNNIRLGANAAARLAFLQLYIATDDISSLFGKVQELNRGGIRVGLNFIFGYKR